MRIAIPYRLNWTFALNSEAIPCMGDCIHWLVAEFLREHTQCQKNE